MPVTVTLTLGEWREIAHYMKKNHVIRNPDGSYPFDNPEPAFTCDAIACVIDLYALYIEDDDADAPLSITVPPYAKDLIDTATIVVAS